MSTDDFYNYGYEGVTYSNDVPLTAERLEQIIAEQFQCKVCKKPHAEYRTYREVVIQIAPKSKVWPNGVTMPIMNYDGMICQACSDKEKK